MKDFNRFCGILFLILQVTACFSQKAMDLYPVSLGEKWGYIDKNGVTVIPLRYDRTWFDPYKTINVVADSKGKMLIDNNDKPLTGDHYSSFFCSYGTPFISVQDSTGLWGCIDTTAKFVIPCQYPELIYFSDGIATVKKNDVQGYYDMNLKFTRIEGFDDMFAANEGFIIVVNGKGKDRREGVFDTKTGKLTVPPVFYSIGLIRNGRAVAIKPHGRGDGVIDVRTARLTMKPRKGQHISTATHNSDIVREIFLNDLYVVRRKGRTRITDFEGKRAVKLDKSYRSGYVGPFYNGYARIALKDLEGLVDSTGKLRFEPEYNQVGIVLEGMVSVQRDKKWGIVDTNGRIIVPIQYDEVYFYGGLIVCISIAEGRSYEENRHFISYRNYEGNLVWPKFGAGEEK